MSELLTRRFLDSRDAIAASLHARFPAATREDVEDALYDAYADLLDGPAHRDVRAGLIYTAAWRRLRARFRRHSHQHELLCPRYDALGLQIDPGQAWMVMASRWLDLFAQTVARHAGGQPDLLRRAMLDKMETGDTDVAVASRHGIRRERLCRAWRAFLEALLPG